MFLHIIGILIFSGLVESNLRILAPSSLALDEDGWMPSTTAAFGTPKYGEHRLGILAAPASASDHCEDDYEFPVNATRDFRVFLFTERGGCSFKRKVVVAQRKKFHAVIFAQDETHIFQDVAHLIPADDGIGGEAKIPSVVVSYADGRRIKRTLRNQEESIIAELSWSVPRRANLRLDLWMSPTSEGDHKFLAQLGPVIQSSYASIGNFSFYPHFNFFSLVPGSDGNFCLDETNEFCADGEPEISGKAVAREQLRLMCMRTWAFNNTQRELNFLDYIIDSHACKSEKFSDACASQYMHKTKIDESDVNRCINDSTLSEFLLQLETASKAWSPQAIRINGFRYEGERSSAAVRLALCSAIPYSAQPDFCSVPETREAESSLLWVILAVVGISCAVIFVILRGMKKQVLDVVHREVKTEVHWAVTERKPLMALQGP